jgi:hypothetical protein
MVRVAQNSKVDINDYQLDENNKRKTATITLERGKARAIIAKMQDKAEFNINTPNAKGTVRGSDVCAFYSAGNSGMLVSEGKLSIASVAHPEDIVLIPAGNSVLVPLEDSPKGPRPYLELEKTLHEEDTSVPVITRSERDSVIRGIVSKFSGDAKITRAGETAPRDAKVGDILKDGDRITTGANGLIEIRFDNGNAMNLKPNTDILIVKLSIDPRTGEYQNLFESNMGEIKARIEGLKGKSKFEVKSPTAVSGARGTIMYMSIQPGKVHVFFEGGNGYLNNLVSNVETTVHAGYNSSADGQGGTSTPVPTSDVDREAWGGGWDPGSGVEGYSAPEGSTGTYLYSDDTGTVTILGTGSTEGPDTELQEFFSDVPQENGGGDTGGGTGGETGGEEETETTSDGYVNGGIGTFEMDNGSFQGVLGLVGTFWNNATATLVAEGLFESLGYEPFVWTGEVGSYNPTTKQYVTSDGGSFYGIAGGIGGINGNDILDGFARLIYIDADGNAGVAGGGLSGVYSIDEAGFTLTGHITGNDYVNGIDVAAEDLYDSIYYTPNDAGDLEGMFGDEDGYISGEDEFMTMSIVNHETGSVQGWGIYGQYIRGEYYNPYDNTWFSAVMGGNDAFGAYRLGDDDRWTLRDDYGYWIAAVNSIDRDDIFGWDSESHTLYGSLNGYFITYTKMGMINGLFIGNFTDEGDGYGYWEAIGMGEWNSLPLTHVANFYGYSDDESFEFEGLMGGFESLWSSEGEHMMLGMGTYDDYGYGERYYDGDYDEDIAGIWYSDGSVYSQNYINETQTTYDGGAYYGVMGGTRHNDSIYGLFYALCIDNSNNAGILRANIDGVLFPDIGMFEFYGGSTRTHDYGYIGISAEDLADSIYETSGEGRLSGEFFDESELIDDPGLIEGYDEFNTMSIVNRETGEAQNWGIYSQYLSGEYFREYITSQWQAVMGGNDAFGAYRYDEGDGYWDFDSDYGYWIARVNSFLGGEVEGWDMYDEALYAALSGRFLTLTKMGTLNGILMGIFSDEEGEFGYYWEAVGAGEWEGTPLTFSGRMGMEESGLYYNYQGEAISTGYMTGLVGGVSSPWYGPAAFTMMGEGSSYGNYPDMFSSTIYSYDAIQESGNTIDGGGFFGYTAGIFLSGEEVDLIKGIAAAIYVDPLGNAGTLTGRLSGGYYPEIEMWMTDGVFFPTLMAPGGEYGFDIYDVITDDLSAMMAGNFGDSDLNYLISGQTVSGHTAAIDGQNWGIYTLTFGAENDNDYNNAGGYKTWYGDMVGYGSFASGQYSMGALRGDILGKYYEDDAVTGSGYWIASSVGTWNEIFNDGYGFEGEHVFYGLIGGIFNDDVMIGKMVGIYGTPDMFDYLEESNLSLINGYGAFDDGGNMAFDYFDGVTVRMGVGDWAVWGARMGGEYSAPKPIFKLMMLGNDSFKGDADGYWFGISIGTKTQDSSVINGFFRGLYYNHEGEGENIAGLIKGDLVGVLKDDGTWESVTLGYVDFIGETEINPDGELDFLNYITGGNFTGRGAGCFESGGSFDVAFMEGSSFQIVDQDWGVWMATMGGTCSDASGTFRTAVAGLAGPDEAERIFATVTGYNESGNLVGSFKGVWIHRGESEYSVTAGTITGDVSGYIDVDAPGVWSAVGAGEWVEVTDILNEHTMFGEMGMSTINDYISMPITEVYANVMSGPGSFTAGGNISAVMDMSMYALSATAMQGIWTAIINGTYSGATGNEWNVTVNNGADSVTLSGTLWDDDNAQWAANVSGTVGGNTITNGQAGGTFSDGTFTGVGAGTWVEQPPVT